LHLFGAFLVCCAPGASSVDVDDATAAAGCTIHDVANVISDLAPTSFTRKTYFLVLQLHGIALLPHCLVPHHKNNKKWIFSTIYLCM
jgi:hypothetical protein